MQNIEKSTENLFEEPDQLLEQPAEEQIIEGEVDNVLDWESLLPEGINKDMINSYMTIEGKRHWTLRPNLIKDEAEQKRVINDMKSWGAV